MFNELGKINNVNWENDKTVKIKIDIQFIIYPLLNL